ncbi:sigma-70 family RNA polymerase sigma factor [Pelatocladus sp. BLCC-F211]|uniref:sigma-70 family RNA polymerase sigma factor n=1 Tax=Pelatocladus sp. BLCC-F211 TaxID=3342752 RepID=UPI0035B9619F
MSKYSDNCCYQSLQKRNKLAHANRNLVHRVVHRVAATCREPYEDLYQIGYIGLIKACERYDPSTGNAFSSFAVPYIQGEIQHYLRDQWQSVKIPRTVLESKAKIKRLKQSLHRLGREEIQEIDIAAGIGINKNQWQFIEAIDANVVTSLDELLHEVATEIDEASIEDSLLHKLISELPFNQKNAILERFFLGKSIDKIARNQGASVEEIKSRINLGISKLRKHLHSELL